MFEEFLRFVIGALCCCGIVFAFWYFSEAQRVKRALRAAPVTTIATMRAGEIVRVVGSLRLRPHRLQAPLSGRPCAVYSLLVREKHGRSSREIFRESEAVEFAIDDSSGTVLVRPEVFRLGLVEDHNQRSGVWHDASDAVVAYLQSKGQSPKNWLGFNRALQFYEAVLEEDEPVAVLGVVVLEPDPEPTSAGEGYRDRPMRKVLVTPPGGAMFISDAPEALT